MSEHWAPSEHWVRDNWARRVNPSGCPMILQTAVVQLIPLRDHQHGPVSLARRFCTLYNRVRYPPDWQRLCTSVSVSRRFPLPCLLVMNNGDRHPTNPHPSPAGDLVPFALNTIAMVTPEDYMANLRRIQQAKAALAFYEEQNTHGLQRYYDEQQALEAAVQQGRLAAQRLAQLQGYPVTDLTIDLLSPSILPFPTAGPCSSTAGQAYLPGSQPLRGSAQGVTELPTSTSIVEVQISRLDRPTTSDPSAHNNPMQYAPGQHRLLGSSAFLPQQYANTVPAPNSSMAYTQVPHVLPHYAGAATTRMVGPYQQQLSYQSAARCVTNQGRSHPRLAYTQRSPISQQAQQQVQPSNFYCAGSIPSQETATPHTPSMAGAATVALTRQPSSIQGPAESRYGAGTTFLNGSLGDASKPSRKNVQTVRTRQAHTEPPEHANLQQPSINANEEQQIFEFFKHMSPGPMQELMFQVLITIERKQKGGAVPAAEEAAKKTLNPVLQQACELISERLKADNQTVEYTTSTPIGMQPQAPRLSQPSGSTFTQAAPNGPMPRAPTCTFRQIRPVASTSPSTATAVPNFSANLNAATTTSVPRAGAQAAFAQRTPLGWYTPMDPRMPVAYGDYQGNTSPTAQTYLQDVSGSSATATSSTQPSAVAVQAARAPYGYKRKGKGKAKDFSVDINLTTEPRSASPAPSSTRGEGGVLMVARPSQPYAKKRKVMRDVESTLRFAKLLAYYPKRDLQNTLPACMNIIQLYRFLYVILISL
ncbi:hypothetical protein OH77DRAFT_1440747 [Trametes cingulata]|nr:hypothetical protein OH77DRAFT_1440747 [Trametes cingulata]